MKKNFCAWLAASAGILSLGAFPLEWNSNNKTGIPYEVEIDRTKLEEASIAGKDCGFEIFSVSSDGRRKLDSTILQGKKAGTVAVRFTVPEGTTALECEPVESGEISTLNADCNLFSGALDSELTWQRRRGKIKGDNGKMCFVGSNFSYPVDVPENLAGCAVKFDLDLKNIATSTISLQIKVEQIDANGKVLPESLTDPRWTSMMYPSNVPVAHRECGRIHPKARRLRLNIKSSTESAAFEISCLAVRAAEQIPFPKYRDEFFARGVSGSRDDFSFNTNSEGSKKLFYFATTSQAYWAEGKIPNDKEDLFFPTDSGTVEAWYNPQWKHVSNSSVYLFSAISSNSLGHFNDVFSIKYSHTKKQAELLLKNGTAKPVSRTFRCDIPANRWSHVAAQWSQDNGIQIFVNGSKVFEDRNLHFIQDSLSDIIRKRRSTRNNSAISILALCGADDIGRKNPMAQVFPGKIDLLRISSENRYDNNFTPAKTFEMDNTTKALFDFNRSFDGKTSAGLQVISASIQSDKSIIDNKLNINGQTVTLGKESGSSQKKYSPKRIDLYPGRPDSRDFNAARKTERQEFDFNGNGETVISLDEQVIMDFIEYKNTGENDLIHPFIRRTDEIDPRSFQDISKSLGDAVDSPKKRAEKLFHFLTSAHDYYRSQLIGFAPDSDRVTLPAYAASKLFTVNAYCGLEHGPFAYLLPHLLASGGAIPANLCSISGSSAQLVWINGKCNFFCFASGKIFHHFDDTEPASLEEIEREPGIAIYANNSNARSFIRCTPRTYGTPSPLQHRKVAMTIRPGETLRMWFSNNGKFNILESVSYSNRRTAKTVNKLVHSSGKDICESANAFPDFGSAFLLFDGEPEKYEKIFTGSDDTGFCYQVDTCYPVVCAEYCAKLKDGTFAEFEISTDNGKTFRTLKSDADGTARPVYPVCARNKYLVKIKAPISAVANFSASTQMVTNTRIMTCKLKPGENNLVYTADNDTAAKVTLQYRKYAKDIKISGNVISTGVIRGFERLTTAITPGKSAFFNISGISGDAFVKTTGKLEGSLKNGQLTLRVTDANVRSIECATIVDGDAEKQLTVLIHPDIELITANRITPLSNARRSTSSPAGVILNNSSTKVKAAFQKNKTPGKYMLISCVKFSSPYSYFRVEIMLPGGKNTEIFSSSPGLNEYFTNRIPEELPRWVIPCNYDGRHILCDTNSSFNSLTCSMPRGYKQKVEITGMILLKNPDQVFMRDATRALCGFNFNKWYMDEQNAKK